MWGFNMHTEGSVLDILKQGKESTVRYKSNSQLSVLDGVPIAIKDEFDQVG